MMTATSNNNPVLRMLRETAGTLHKPQYVVARNWTDTRAMTARYNPNRNVGITRTEYNRAMTIIRRLAGQ